jgi:RNA polymerase sigma-70 factor, ECF subfamily
MLDRNVELAAAGDVNAFEELYKSHHRRVYGLCARMTRSVSEAEDLTQEVFIQVFRKLKTFRGESSFATWLHRLTVNEVLMYFRKPVVRVERTTEDDSIPTRVVVGTEDPAQMSLVDRISLEEAIRQLSPGYRAVFVLHDVEGYEHQQIGQMLGCAVGTSKSQLHKARMKLRRLLKKRVAPQQTIYNLQTRTLSLDLQQQMLR